MSDRHPPDTPHTDPHDRGLAYDLAHLTARRRVLAGLGAGMILSAGSFGGPSGEGEANTLATSADGATCIKDPGETAGPYPGDGTNDANGQTANVLAESGVMRTDIRSSFAGLTPVAGGVQLDIVLALVNAGGACQPLAGHAVYLRHCDAAGQYSIYDTPDRNYLRGVNVSDAGGKLRFTTVYPGCYTGRWPHIHFEVFASAEAAVSGKAAILTSQLLLPEEICTMVYIGNPSYPASLSALQGVSVLTDMVFGDNTAEQLQGQTPTFSGDITSGLLAFAQVGLVVCRAVKRIRPPGGSGPAVGADHPSGSVQAEDHFDRAGFFRLVVRVRRKHGLDLVDLRRAQVRRVGAGDQRADVEDIGLRQLIRSIGKGRPDGDGGKCCGKDEFLHNVFLSEDCLTRRICPVMTIWGLDGQL